jgi:hypothetical protein
MSALPSSCVVPIQAQCGFEPRSDAIALNLGVLVSDIEKLDFVVGLGDRICVCVPLLSAAPRCGRLMRVQMAGLGYPYTKARRIRAICVLVAGTGFEPVTFRL